MSSFHMPNEINKEVDLAFKNLNSPMKLGQSGLISLFVVAKYKQENPAVLPAQALKIILTNVLDLLEQENHPDADLLRKRFWKGQRPQEMVLSKSELRTFYYRQKKARDEFCELLWQMEQNCRPHSPLQPPQTVNTIPSKQADSDLKTTISAHANSRIVQVLLVGVFAILIISSSIFAFNQGPQRQSIATPITVSSTATTLKFSPTPTLLSASATKNSVCDETERIAITSDPLRFVRSQGVSSFNVQNTSGILNNKIRALAIDNTGLWIGYLSTSENSLNGLSYNDKVSLLNCGLSKIIKNQNINAIVVGQTGKIWVGTEESGIASFNGKEWRLYTTRDGLPSNQIYSLMIDKQGNVWAGTWEGVAKFNGEIWSIPYQVENGTLSNNHVHAIAIDDEKNIWVGHISAGVSEYRQLDSTWISYDISTEPGLAGNEIRTIIIRPKSNQQPESIWFATADGGISRFQQGEWTVYRVEDGLPSNAVNDLALDRYNRVWAATDKGVSYFDDKVWKRYDTLDTLTIAIGNNCADVSCPFDDDQVLTGTRTMGLTHSRLPLPVPAIKILKVCFAKSEKDDKECVVPISSYDTSLSESILTAKFPKPLLPSEKLYFEVIVSPEKGYQLREEKGDFLSNTDEGDFNLFHAYPRIQVKGIEGILKTVEVGEPYAFIDYDNPFIAPNLPDGTKEKQFISTWRVWMFTRYVGPYIRLLFNVQK